MVLSINPNLSSPRYIFEFLCSPIGQHRLLANASQVGVPAIARPTTNVKSISIVAPCIELLRAFEMLVEPMLKRVVANTSESMTLAALRDTLLPKLISGDLRVKECCTVHGGGRRMTPLPPWANGPFELLVHAEGHLLGGEDFDRRIALISFDNAVEVAIATYLTLNPIQRGGRAYPRVDVDRWLNNYHTKLDFSRN